MHLVRRHLQRRRTLQLCFSVVLRTDLYILHVHSVRRFVAVLSDLYFLHRSTEQHDQRSSYVCSLQKHIQDLRRGHLVHYITEEHLQGTIYSAL